MKITKLWRRVCHVTFRTFIPLTRTVRALRASCRPTTSHYRLFNCTARQTSHQSSTTSPGTIASLAVADYTGYHDSSCCHWQLWYSTVIHKM